MLIAILNAMDSRRSVSSGGRLCGCATMGQLRAGVHWNTLEIFEKCERHRFLMSGATPTRSQRRRLAVLGGKERVLSFLVLPYCCSW